MKRFWWYMLALGLVLLALIWWNIASGSVSYSLDQLMPVLLGRVRSGEVYQIVWNNRLPRILAALILGGALALSGFLLQTFFANPIAGPFVLGISSGAKLAVAITLIVFLDHGLQLSSTQMVLAAFVGSLISMGLVLAMSFRVRRMSMLIVCGIMIGYICSAITDLFVTFADDSNIVNLHNWSMGSLSAMSWGKVKVMAVTVAVGFIVTFLLAKPISAYRLGENYARSMGVNIRALRVAMILLSSLLSGCVVAFAGPISFVGIAVPHIARSISRTSKPLLLIPACFFTGSAVTLLCDGIARVAFAPMFVSISSVTAVLLVPVVIAMMLKRQEARQ